MMTRLCRRGHGLLAFALIAASACPYVVPISASDLNNDHRVDVLDLQCLGAALLSETQAPSFGDVNNDGRIDVLDFQCAVNMATGQAKDGTEQPARPEAPSVPARAPSSDLIAVRLASQATIAPPACDNARATTVAPAPSRRAACALHRLGLAPNAPPSC